MRIEREKHLVDARPQSKALCLD